MSPLEDLITLSDLADRCGVDVRTVRRWCNTSVPGLPVTKIGRTPYVSKRDWDGWLAARRVERNPVGRR